MFWQFEAWYANRLARNATNGVFFNESQSVCTRGEEFVLDIGSFTVVGPSPISQEITCIAGRVCDLQIFGVGIEDELRLESQGDNDKPYQPYMILDTCGINSGYKRSDIQKHGSPTVPMAGGSYQLCWCGSSGFSCQVPAEFLLPFGEVQVLGPTLQQDRTCVAGQSCRLESIISFGPGFGEILVLDTCSVGRPNFLDNNELRLPFLGVLSDSNASSWSTSWQFGRLLAGKYRLCWSSSSWEELAHLEHLEVASNVSKFTSFVDIGMLWIRGTSQFQDRTCMSGQTCRIDGILGLGLGDLDVDSVMALHTCGLNAPIPRWAWSGAAVSTTENGTAFAWGSEVVSAVGGRYRLCWCGGAGGGRSDCVVPEDFVVDFGALWLLGPTPTSFAFGTQSCISGQRCALRLDDPLDPLDFPQPGEVVILDTCGIGQSYFPAISVASNASVSLGWITASGQYRICWCALQSDWDCENAKHFHDVGSLVLLGPTLEQDKTCISGQSCRIDVAGIGLEGTFAILDTCGTGDSERDRAQGLGMPGWSVFVPALPET